MSKESLDHDAVGEKTYRRIRTDIVFGRLAPGARLRLDRMRADYGVSVGTLRELLSRLASEGLVVAEGQRGFEVAPVSARAFHEIAALRLLLECHAIAQSFAAGDMDWEGRVVAAHHKLAWIETRLQAREPADGETWKRYDFEFHHALISACGSETLLEAHAPVYDKYLRYLMIAGTFRGEIAAREHRTLLDCALNRDAAAAVDILRAHVEACVAFTVANGAYEVAGQRRTLRDA